MKSMPQALFVVDPRKERNAIAEARKLNIPIVGIVDTNCDPDEIDYVIPANDDAIRAVKLLTAKMADAILEGQQGVSNEEVAAEQNIDLDEKEKSEETYLGLIAAICIATSLAASSSVEPSTTVNTPMRPPMCK